MNLNTLWSLRLGFSNKQADAIAQKGIQQFLKDSFAAMPDTTLPAFLKDEPVTLADLQKMRDSYKATQEGKKMLHKKEKKISYAMKSWWIDKMASENYPLREKMTVFWHNHYVSTYQKVNNNMWVYEHNQLLRENAFGNFRELTKKILRTNAMVVYLDNTQNRKDKYNENLGRELLELFTLGVGNYTEQEIKNGAKGLAGLTLGDNGAEYRRKFENNEPFAYFGKTGNFKSDEMVDIIFEQKNVPYFITRKILKWFIYDNPPEGLVTYYGNYLKDQDFEIEPLLTKMFTEEFSKPTAGSKIKDPLVYILQLYNELNIKNQNNILTTVFIRDQGMDLFNQPNVKGWIGGDAWLTAQLFLQRNNAADQLCKGQNLNKNLVRNVSGDNEVIPDKFDTQLYWSKNGNNKDVIAQLKDRLLFSADESLQADFESILKYDFNPNSEGADNGVMRLFNYIVKTPEFQLI